MINETCLKDLSQLITSGSRGWAPYYSKQGAIFLRMTNIPKSGINLLLDDIKHVSLPDKSKEGKRTSVQKGDILISITAELGKIGYVDTNLLGEAYVNQHVCLVRVNPKKANTKYIAYYLSSHKQRNLFQRLNDSGAKSGLNLSTISNFPIKLPDEKTQDFIVQTLEKWDGAIKSTEKIIELKKQQFKWLTNCLISKTNHPKSLVSNVATEISFRNRNREITRVLSVTNHKGFVLPEDRFERRVASADLSNYKIVTCGQYAYNPSRINVGSIARLDSWESGALSPMYVVFELAKEKIDSDYFSHWLSSSEAKQRIKRSAQGSVRETVGFNDLSRIPIPLPSIDEQNKISETLNTAKKEIELLENLVKKYQEQKRGLMQKFLTGEWHIKELKEAA